MKRRVLCLSILGVALSVIAFYQALSAAPYYEGKRINLIVGFSPGGGYDVMARLVAKHLPRYIPGKPIIVVENMTGAGSIVCANHIYNIAKPDGLTIGTFERAIPVAQLLKAEGVKFDAARYAWIGSPVVEPYVLALRADLPYRTFNDLRNTKGPLFLGGIGTTGEDTAFPLLLKEFAGLDVKMIVYPAGAEVMLAIERKEADGRVGSYSSLKQYVERGLVRLLVRGRVSEPEIEGLPVNEDLITDGRGKTLMAILSSVDRIGRPYAAPPGTPAEIIGVLRDAFTRLCGDSEFKSDAAKAKIRIEHVPPEVCQKMSTYVISQPEDIVREFSKYMKF